VLVEAPGLQNVLRNPAANVMGGRQLVEKVFGFYLNKSNSLHISGETRRQCSGEVEVKYNNSMLPGYFGLAIAVYPFTPCCAWCNVSLLDELDIRGNICRLFPEFVLGETAITANH
jgi:hypothetical protein